MIRISDNGTNEKVNKMEEIRECKICGNELPKIDEMYYSINLQCKSCAHTTYVIWRDLHENKEKRKED